MHRVELKGFSQENARTGGGIKFLMHRVELKVPPAVPISFG
jgi:hypothetical protein